MSPQTETATSPPHPAKFFSPILGTGLLLLLFSVGIVIFASDNFLAIGLGWFTFLIAIGLIMMGALQAQPLKKTQSEYRELTREIVKVRCSHCGSLNFETSTRCSNCGANL